VLIAPETGGILAERTRMLERAAPRRGLGSSASAVELTADKLRLGRHLAGCGIPTPPGRRVVPRDGLPADFPYPAVLKPVDGAGAQDTYLVPEARRCPAAALAMPSALLQPYLSGTAQSASFLVDRNGKARLIAAGCQHIDVRNGRFSYRGGMLPIPPREALDAPRRAVESVPGLFGFVGVDFLWDESMSQATMLEINPRPTTSCVALARWLSPGRLARAWLDAVSGNVRTDATGLVFPDADLKKTVTFTAGGAMMMPHEGVPP
jgi:predicted ATP-grasp superfamily ATP-dependent carboligase